MHQTRRLWRRALSVLKSSLSFWFSRPLLLSAVVAIVATGIAFGSVRALSWMETPAFCAQCHTMKAEVEAHTRSPHQTVECTECHVGRGLGGFVKAKWDGMNQLVKVVTGMYARPITQGAAHGMPPTDETCLRCHNPGRQRGDLLITRSYFQQDRYNSEQRMALVVRLSEASQLDTKGIHWHVLSTVEYLSTGATDREIDWIRVREPDGTVKLYISREEVEISEQAGDRAAELQAAGKVRKMTCYDCHNRVGHTFPTRNRAVDEALRDARIDPDLPLIKRRSMEVLEADYATVRAADEAIMGVGDWYHQTYPYLFLEKPAELLASLETLADIYRQTASPEVGVFAESYPSFLGHTDSAGCFRCHDGGHYKIEKGRLSEEAIPSRCSACHTFPSVGDKVPNVMLGPAPSSHEDRLWVFNHKDVAPSLEVAGSSCSSCHSQSYCSNCHATGAKAVNHDDMYFNHADVIKQNTQEPCAYCHQKAFCLRCHKDDEVELGG